MQPGTWRRRKDSESGDERAWHHDKAEEKKRRKRIAWLFFGKFRVNESAQRGDGEACIENDGLSTEGAFFIVPDAPELDVWRSSNVGEAPATPWHATR